MVISSLKVLEFTGEDLQSLFGPGLLFLGKLRITVLIYAHAIGSFKLSHHSVMGDWMILKNFLPFPSCSRCLHIAI